MKNKSIDQINSLICDAFNHFNDKHPNMDDYFKEILLNDLTMCYYDFESDVLNIEDFHSLLLSSVKINREKIIDLIKDIYKEDIKNHNLNIDISFIGDTYRYNSIMDAFQYKIDVKNIEYVQNKTQLNIDEQNFIDNLEEHINKHQYLQENFKNKLLRDYFPNISFKIDEKKFFEILINSNNPILIDSNFFKLIETMEKQIRKQITKDINLAEENINNSSGNSNTILIKDKIQELRDKQVSNQDSNNYKTKREMEL